MVSTSAITRVGDTVEGTCWAPGHPVRHFVGHWVRGASYSSLDGLQIIRVGDEGITDCGHKFHAITGSGVGMCEGRAIHRVGDQVIVDEGGEGVSVSGSSVGVCA